MVVTCLLITWHSCLQVACNEVGSMQLDVLELIVKPAAALLL